MDELELLKKDWKKQESNYPKLSYDEIYNMILKKSSSIVKWIFIISILEFLFWLAIAFLFKDTESMELFNSYDKKNVLWSLTLVSYGILAYFFYRFYMNYRNISVTDSAKKLMENILRTRRTVRHYVAFNLIVLAVSTFVALGIMFENDATFAQAIEKAAADGEMFKVYAVTILVTLLMLALVIGLILIFYYLIYGLLLKRLNRNYKELRKLEV